jgi:HSP20 family protein
MFLAPVVRTRAALPAYRSIDSSFERFVNDALYSRASRTVPGTAVAQDDKSWTITLDLPGVPREQLGIHIEGAQLRIETVADCKRPFKAAYEMPQEIDVDATTATLEHGVLTLVVAKQAPMNKARQIEIR